MSEGPQTPEEKAMARAMLHALFTVAVLTRSDVRPALAADVAGEALAAFMHTTSGTFLK